MSHFDANELLSRIAAGEIVCSRNAEARLRQGWVIGSPRYASSEPHHIGEQGQMAYVDMYNPRRERDLALLVDGEHEGETAAEGHRVSGLWIASYVNDLDTMKGPSCLLRVRDGFIDEIRLPDSVVVYDDGDATEDEPIEGEYDIDGVTYRYRVVGYGLTAERC